MLQVTPENGLFHLVCSNCAHEVSRWYIFKQQVIQSFEIGRYLLDKKQKMLSSPSTNNVIQSGDGTESQNLGFVVDDGTSNSVIENMEKLKNLLKEDNSDKVHCNTGTDDFFQDDKRIDLKDDSESSNNVLEDSSTVSPVRNLPRQKKTLDELLCKICNKQCTSTNSYNRHIKTHDDARPYICSKCDKPFKTSQVLNEHLKRHYDDRRHKCGICGQKFYAKSSLNDHIRSHTGEKPFKCGSCDRTFSTKAILRQHSVVSLYLVDLNLLNLVDLKIIKFT